MNARQVKGAGWWARFLGRASDNAQILQAGRDIVYQPQPAGLPVPLTPPSKVWNLPGLVATFAARDLELEAITAHFSSPGAGLLVLYGIPGVGKSQLALAWAHRHGAELEIVWHVRASDRLAAVADLAQLADRLKIASGADQEEAATTVVNMLNGRSGWLLLFDDARPDSVQGLLPYRGGHVLLTSRSPNWGPVASGQEVGLFAPQAAATFLDPLHDPPSDAAARLANQLGYLPLALEQARAYCAATGRTLEGYIADYREQRLLRHGIDEKLHASVHVTVALALAEAHHREPASAQLGLLFAQLAPTSIPRDLPTAALHVLPLPLRRAIEEGASSLDLLMATLLDLALITVERPGQVRMHQLVAELLRDQAPSQPTRLRWRRRVASVPDHWPDTAIGVLDGAMQRANLDPATWDRLALLPHAIALLARPGHESLAAASLANHCGAYLHDCGEYSAARMLFETAVDIRVRILGGEHLDTLTSSDSLGRVLRELGDFAAARNLHERILAACRRTLGDENRYTLAAMEGLASVLRSQGDLAAARELYEQIVPLSERLMTAAAMTDAPSSLDFAVWMNNFAAVMADQGEVETARGMQERALTLFRKLAGDDAPGTLGMMNNLANLLRRQENLTAARELLETVVKGSRRVLGDEHPKTLIAQENLAKTLHEQGDPESARTLHEQVLAARRRVLGDEHPDTILSIQAVAGMIDEPLGEGNDPDSPNKS
ncbi:tetratricopeptide repeat protein [Micromonospora sp. NPDC047740]|uniref:tetratricopeptide repeat protein n=1 Tax=Micromonospora sp. NPDC047740 TaxID=3364254 RepID=UPI003711BB9C